MAESIIVTPASVVDALRFDCPVAKPFSFQLHKHDRFCEMLFIRDGSGTFEVDGKSYEARPGAVLIYHPGIWHEELSRSHPFRATFIAFRGLRLKHLPPEYFLERERDPIIQLDLFKDFQSLYDLATEIEHEWLGRGFEYQALSNQLLGVLIARLTRYVYSPRVTQSAKKGPTETVYRARRYIEENYDLDISLSKLASHTYMNAYHLAHIFKEEVGVSPIRFHIEYRIEVAKRYLKTTDMSIRQIGESVGYRSETSFHHLFRNITGKTPGQYRLESQSMS